MTDEQLFWAGLITASIGLLVSLGALFGPHLLWRLQNRPSRRGRVVDGHKWL